MASGCRPRAFRDSAPLCHRAGDGASLSGPSLSSLPFSLSGRRPDLSLHRGLWLFFRCICSLFWRLDPAFKSSGCVRKRNRTEEEKSEHAPCSKGTVRKLDFGDHLPVSSWGTRLWWETHVGRGDRETLCCAVQCEDICLQSDGLS